MNTPTPISEITDNPSIDFHATKAEFASGAIYLLTRAQLRKRVAMLVNLPIDNERLRHQALIMADAIHSTLLDKLIQDQDVQNDKSQKAIERLTVLAIVVAVLQLVVAIALR